MDHIYNALEEGRNELRITAEDVREGLSLDARRFMQLGLGCELAFWVLLIAGASSGPLVYLLGATYVGTALATALGVARGAKASDMRPATQVLFLLLALVGVVRLIPIAAFVGRSHPMPSLWQPQAPDRPTAEAARQRSQVRQQQRANKAAAPSQPGAIDSEGFESVPRSEPDAYTVLWPAATDTVRQQALTRLSTAVPRIRLIDTEGHADGELMRAELVVRDLNIPFEVDLSRLELPLTRATKGVFGVQYVVDDGNRYTAVVESDLTEAGLSLNDLHRMALANLRRLVKEELKLKRANPKNPANSAFRIKLDGYHESSALLLDDLWDKALKKHIPNGVVAVMPSRDVCTFIDLSALTKGGLADLREAMVQAKRVNGEVINAILHRQGRTWALAGQVDGI